VVRQRWERLGVGNLEAVELGLRQALLKDGRQLLEKLLEEAAVDLPENSSQKGEKCHPDRGKQIETLFGPVQIRRQYFYRPSAGQGRIPLDEALGLMDGSSPGLVRLASRAAARSGYEAASQDLEALAGVQIEGRQIQRIVQQSGPAIAQQLLQGACVIEKPIPIMYIEVDGTGVPMIPEELEGRKGKQPDGSAKTREVKLGCVFTQTLTDEEGHPLRDHQSTTYVGSFESAQAFGLKSRQEAQRRGIGSALLVVFLGDGSAWVWELARVNFPQAICILDLYHAVEHLNDLCKSLYAGSEPWIRRMQEQWFQQMENDGIEEVIASARRRLSELDPVQHEAIEKQIAYFENNKQRMLYKTYRQKGYFCGSGVVEAGCKTVVGQRLKQSGMLWGPPGAQSVLELRCALLGNRWDECWNRLHQSDYLQIKAVA
jgi:GNAT superfamily N-acetyltransferase